MLWWVMLAGLLLSVNENTDGREFFYVMLWNVSLKVSTFNQFRRGEKNRSSIVEEYYPLWDEGLELIIFHYR